MTENMLDSILVFTGLMSLLFTLRTIIVRAIDAKARKNLPPVPAALEARVARIEQIVEATSIEVERISEGQRFTTKLLTERAPALKAGDS